MQFVASASRGATARQRDSLGGDLGPCRWSV